MDVSLAIILALGTAVLGTVLLTSVAIIVIFVIIAIADVADLCKTNNKEYPS